MRKALELLPRPSLGDLDGASWRMNVAVFGFRIALFIELSERTERIGRDRTHIMIALQTGVILVGGEGSAQGLYVSNNRPNFLRWKRDSPRRHSLRSTCI